MSTLVAPSMWGFRNRFDPKWVEPGAWMGGEDGASERLKLRLRELYEQAGSPGYDRLVRHGAAQRPAVELSPSSLSGWFSGVSVPSDPRKLRCVVELLERLATERDPVRRSLPSRVWEERRSEAVSERRPRGRPRRGHQDQDPVGNRDKEGRAGHPIGVFTDPYALEVHRAIEAPEHAWEGLPELPVYVPRAHDERLRMAVDRAVGGSGSLVSLVAASSTGKTRACWEAIRRLPSNWRLWHPIDPGRPDAALAGLSQVGPRTVVWLNEAQFYLLTVDGTGERVAAGLRELLRDPARGPVLVLATLWPEYWTTLTGPGDEHAQARALLTGSDVSVPAAFVGVDLEALRVVATADPRLAKAMAEGRDGAIAQYLAGAPALLARFRNASAPLRVIIEAAMDARRLGHGPGVPWSFLEAAAEDYLTDDEWNEHVVEGWFENAMAAATARCPGATVAPLTRMRPLHRERVDRAPVYRLADVLEQHGRRTRGALCPSSAFWQAALEHANGPMDRHQLADAARARLRLDHAKALLGTVISETNDAVASDQLAILYENAGDRAEAERLLRTVAQGNPHSLARLATLREEAGDHVEAGQLMRAAAEAGHPDALGVMIGRCDSAGDHEEAERLMRASFNAGNRQAAHWLIDQRMRPAGDLAGVERLARAGAAAGHPYLLLAAAKAYEDAGSQADAERVAQAAADIGYPAVLMWLASSREKRGEHEDAQRFLQMAAAAGDRDALWRLARLHEQAGEHTDAERLAHAAAAAGNRHALKDLALRREQAGDHVGAERLAHAADKLGRNRVIPELVDLRRRAGDRSGAERLLHEAAALGNRDALFELTKLSERANDPAGAERLAYAAADAGTFLALVWLSKTRHDAGDDAGAERLAYAAAETGDANVLGLLAEMRDEAGDRAGAERLAYAAACAGGTHALEQLAMLREVTGDRATAERLARAAADAGNPHALRRVVELREGAAGGPLTDLMRHGLGE
ncbi:tetratricopeptide repeat protein [Embleya sp. NPDC050493]|uniref:tetratricopeptide repeat protein n=1 Tax=Embleya sp. NPDC050493 TaxID=3363989 RepID=UPI0037AD645F